MSKPRIVKDYEKLSDEIVEQIKLVYPYGFERHLVSFMNRDGEKRKGLPFETEEFYYLIRMTSEKAMSIIEDDDDFDDDGNLKTGAKKKLEAKYLDEDFLNALNSNDDNDLGFNEDGDGLDEEEDDDDDF